MDRRRVIGSLAALAVAPTGARAVAGRATPRQPELAVGQEWTIRGWPDPNTRVIIGRIETLPDGRIAVSASLVGLTYDGGPSVCDHFAFDKVSLERSLDRVVATGVAPPAGFEDG
jgi:hypothetical protein